jgi:glutamate racemase
MNPERIAMPAGGEKAPRSIVITDSGLGGLSVCAEVIRGLHREVPRSLALTYFNARPEQDGGYSLLPSMEEQVRVFDQALLGMARFHPDLLVIACNTLSALYPRTAFSRASGIPALGIIELGVQMIFEQLRAQPDSRVIILGSPVTIEEGSHVAQLVAQGIRPDRILAQPCPGLALQIEADPAGPAVRQLIDQYVAEAAKRLQAGPCPILAALCCTHYGYSQAAFQRALAARFPGPVSILNPNQAMSARVCRDQAPARIELDVVSRVPWSPEKLAAISAALEPVSPLAARGLRQYRQDPDLFSF